MQLSELETLKNDKKEITKAVLKRFDTQKQGELLKVSGASDLYLFDVPFFTSKIQKGKPKIEFLDNVAKISLARFFEFYQTLFESARKLVRKNTESKVKLNTQLVLDLIEQNDFLQKTYELLNVKIKPKQLDDSMFQLIFPVFISKDLSVSGWLSFYLSVQENEHLDLCCQFIEVQNVANLFTCDNVIAKKWILDEVNNPLIEVLTMFFESRNIAEYLQIELPIFTAKQVKHLLSKVKEGGNGTFTKYLSGYITFI